MTKDQESTNGKSNQIISFGIASLDELLGHPLDEDSDATQYGIALESKNETTSLCLIGPDGTGKSVLALHLASHYAAQSDENGESKNGTRVMYVSTDLSYERARATWTNFVLDRPSQRIRKLTDLLPRSRVRTPEPRYRGQLVDFEVELKPYHPLLLEGEKDGRPFAINPLADYLVGQPRNFVKDQNLWKHEVAFIDLEAHTAGDDWGVINRLLASLDQPETQENRHMLIIDAVEGLETLGGHHDAFGHERDRRSRVAQILRAAKDKCHVVFIVEEPKENIRLPEAFVSDAVIRLRVVHERDYDRRTVEIEKLRGQAYVRGQHDCLIRKGVGSMTGKQTNPDHGHFLVPEIDPATGITVEKTRAYFLVLPSLQFLSREIMEKDLDNPLNSSADSRTSACPSQPRGLCGFGIPYLDQMIGQPTLRSDQPYPTQTTAQQKAQRVREMTRFGDQFGLPWGSITALIGDEGTHKARIGRAFLAQTFLDSTGALDTGKGVALMLTTRYINRDELVQSFLSHSRKTPPPISTLTEITNRTLCRRLEIHHLSPANLFFIVHALVQKGLETHLGQTRYNAFIEGKLNTDGPLAPGQIRLVIDDWSAIQDAYPEIRDDPLFLPFLIFYLQRQGITVLILDTQPGRLSHILLHESDRELRSLVPHHLYTWHVTFIGERRVAIAALPPIDGHNPFVIRELKPADGHEERLVVDPHFEFYSGFEDDKQAQPVSLRVHLYQGSPYPDHETRSHKAKRKKRGPFSRRQHSIPRYLEEMTELLRRLFATRRDKRVVELVDNDGYNLYRDLVYLQGPSKLEHTLVVQVDEFWSSEGLTLSNMLSYLGAFTFDGRMPDTIEDPYRLFQPGLEQHHEAFSKEPAEPGDDAIEALRRRIEEADGSVPHPIPAQNRPTRRHEFFRTLGYDLCRTTESNIYAERGKVPSTPPSLPTRDEDKNDPKTPPRSSDPPSDHEHQALVDRVPYYMDYGLLLADHALFRKYMDREPTRTFGGPRNDLFSSPPYTLERIWNSLASYGPDQSRATIPWRAAFEAFRWIASNEANSPDLLAFEVDQSTPETLSSLILEILASEILPVERSRFVVRRDYAPSESLADLLRTPNGQGRWSLFRAWILLNSVVSPDHFRLENLQMKARPMTGRAVAGRHWYSTACTRVETASRTIADKNQTAPVDPKPELTVIRLPGHFSTRGDWFLGIAEGSRSRRQGERVIDILTSRRANITRMQAGMGLPVRGFPDPQSDLPHEVDAEFRSPLHGYQKDCPPHLLQFHEIWRLGGGPFRDLPPEGYHFYWLWRSRIGSYDRHSRIWSKWLLYAMAEMREGCSKKLKSDSAVITDEIDLLGLYDKLPRVLPDQAKVHTVVPPLPIFNRFQGLCEELVQALDRSTTAARSP